MKGLIDHELKSNIINEILIYTAKVIAAFMLIPVVITAALISVKIVMVGCVLIGIDSAIVFGIINSIIDLAAS